jgi:hypothetical protein
MLILVISCHVTMRFIIVTVGLGLSGDLTRKEWWDIWVHDVAWSRAHNKDKKTETLFYGGTHLYTRTTAFHVYVLVLVTQSFCTHLQASIWMCPFWRKNLVPSPQKGCRRFVNIWKYLDCKYLDGSRHSLVSRYIQIYTNLEHTIWNREGVRMDVS